MKKIVILIITFMSFIMVKADVTDVNKEVITDFTPSAKASILIEASTGKILYSKNINEKLPVASLTKLMTQLLAMEALENNDIKLEDEVIVSKNASSMGGSQIYIGENDKITVHNLLKGIGIASANDAAVALSEKIGITEANFVNMMNKKAKELNLTNTNYKNSHGLDEDDHYSSAKDISTIAKMLVKYPLILEISSIYEEYLMINNENRWLVNTNKLIRFQEGVDGLKTGFTDNAGYCNVITMEKNGMRLISVILGSSSIEKRNEESISLLEYGFSTFKIKNVFENHNVLGKTYIDKSIKKYYNYYLKDNINVLLNRSQRDIENFDYEIKLYDNTIPLKNNVVGKLIFKYDNAQIPYDLIVKDEVEKSSFIKNILNNIIGIFSGKI